MKKISTFFKKIFSKEGSELKFKNKKEDIEQLTDTDFFKGLQSLTERYSREVRAYGDRYRIELKTTIHYEIED